MERIEMGFDSRTKRARGNHHMQTCGSDEAGDSIGEVWRSGDLPWGRLHPGLHGHDILL
jgi:hypothetical protein